MRRRQHAVQTRTGQNLVVQQLRAVCLLYTSDAADERSSVDLGGRRIIKKKNTSDSTRRSNVAAH